MPVSPLALLTTRRLWPLTIAQSFSALNDNLVKNAMIVLAMFRLGVGGTGLSALAGALFIAPYVLLSATAGKIADRYPKPRVIVAYKVAEIGLMLGAAGAFLTASVPALLAVLFLLGVQAALFSPVKYGVLPEHLAGNELIAGNGVIEATTFVSIVCGTVAGGGLMLFKNGPVLVSALGIILSLIGLGAAVFIPSVRAADPALRVSPNLVGETWRVLRHAASIRAIWLSVLGLSWFWMMGATLLTEFPVIVRDTLHAGGGFLTLLLAVFAAGVGFGSMQCARLLHGEVSARLVPIAALGISLFCWDFASAAASAARAGAVPSAGAALATLAGWRMIGNLFLLAACGGTFSVPLYAIIQTTAAPTERARMVAANNVMNALFMVAGAATVAGLAAAGLSAPRILHLAALANLIVAAWIIRVLLYDVYRFVLWWYFRIFHRLQIAGLEHYRVAGDRVVIVANHQSYLDACVIIACLPDSPTFAIHTAQATRWFVRPFLRTVPAFPVDVQSPYAVKHMIEAVRDQGRKLMIFPEGRITVTGALMKVYEGAAMVADKAHAQVVVISIDGLQFSRFGRMRGRLRRRWFPPVKVNIRPPVTLSPPESGALSTRRRREVVGRLLHDLMVDAAFRSKETRKSLFSAMLDARAVHGRRAMILEDIQRAPISYDRLLLGAVALGRALSTAAPGEVYIGVMMPNAVASVALFFGMQAFGLVPCLLNVSGGEANILSACRAAGVRFVVSSRTFVEKARLGPVVERLAAQMQFIWLEDVRSAIGWQAKLRAKTDGWRAGRLPGTGVDPNAAAVVLFTSGSESRPKGVVLSHRSVLANCAQLSSVIDFHSGDIAFNAMPMFHAFGLTGGTIVPLISGVRTFHYPSPLHYRVVPALIYDTDATICFSTDTFLNGWARYAHSYDFYAMRYIFAGAEKVREETRHLFADRFGVRILEGYGATETAPVLTMNTALECRAGTVGRFLPGIEWRVELVAGVTAGGRLFVRGENVMLGYVRDEAPGRLYPPEDGWYDTGDIVSVDADGFVTLIGRVKRFAKIGGEMVSMTAAESLLMARWPDAVHAVLGVADARKGEALLVVTTSPQVQIPELLAFARAKGVAEIMVPRAVLVVPKIPMLATGKIDYPAVGRMLTETQGVEAATKEVV